ncbi:MAG TPA: hypothetical protein VGZ29_00410 [Terriglobia bacterium]|nr:hypothetical protein [Terriglobia bacterium]
MRKLVLLAVVALVFALSPAAYAGSIVFSFKGTTSAATWAWLDGTSSLAGKADSATVDVVGDAGMPINGDVSLTFALGPNTGGDGTFGNPYQFDWGGSIVVTGCLPGQGAGCTSTYLFKGQFEAAMAYAVTDYLSFNAPLISGTLNPAIAAMFGFSDVNVLGSFEGVLTCDGIAFGCTSGSDHLVGSADMILMPSQGPCDSASCGVTTPEPDALQLTSLGLLLLMIMAAARRLAKSL